MMISTSISSGMPSLTLEREGDGQPRETLYLPREQLKPIAATLSQWETPSRYDYFRLGLSVSTYPTSGRAEIATPRQTRPRVLTKYQALQLRRELLNLT